jgi:hypothetical protein
MANRRRVAGATLGIVLLTLLTAACGAGEESISWSCAEQTEVAKKLAGDEIFSKVAETLRRDEAFSKASFGTAAATRYIETPCEEGSPGSDVTSGIKYVLKSPLSFESVQKVGDKITGDSGRRWDKLLEVRPSDPGSGGHSFICYKPVGGNDRIRLELSADGPTSQPGDDPASISLYVSLTESDSC